MAVMLHREPRVVALGAGVLALACCSVAVRVLIAATGESWPDLRAWLDVDANGVLPVAYETACLAIASIASAARAQRARRDADRWWRHWAGAAGVLALVAIEKSAGLHEMAAAAVAARFGWIRGGLFGVYLVPATLVLAGLYFAGRPFVAALPRSLRRDLGVGVAVMLVGGIGFEVVAAAWIRFAGAGGPMSVVLGTLEEAGEMLGAAMLAGVLWGEARTPRAAEGEASGTRAGQGEPTRGSPGPGQPAPPP